MATWKTVTVKSTGGDYASLNAALIGEKTDLTIQSGDLVIECHNFSDSTKVVATSFQGWTTNSTHRIVISAADDHAGIWSSSVYRLELGGTNDSCLQINSAEDVVLQGIQLKLNSSINEAVVIWGQGGMTRGLVKFVKCIIIMDHNDSGDTNITGYIHSDSDQDFIFQNCMIYGPGLTSTNRAIRVGASGASGWIDNCVIDGFSVGLSSTSSSIRFRNTRVTNGTSVTSATLHTDSNYNLTDVSGPTNWGANSLDSGDTPTLDYVDDTHATLTSRNYHLNSSSDSGYEAGTDLTSDANDPFSDDIDGTARSAPWDIGAHELSSTVNPTMALYGWRFRDDDGVEGTGGATFMQAEDTGIIVGTSGDVALDAGFRCRIGIDETNTGDPAASVIQIRAKLNGGAAFDVTAVSTVVQMRASTNFVDGAATTDHGLAAPAGTFLAGEILETDGSTTSLNLAQNQYTIIEAAIEVLAAGVVDDDTIEIGLRHDGVDYFPGVTMITVNIVPAPDTPGSFAAGTPTGTTIPVTWTDPNSGTALPKVWISDDAGANWDLVATLSATTVAYTFTGLATGTLYSVGCTYFNDPFESIMAEDTATTIGADQTITTTTATMNLVGVAGDITTGSGPTRDPPTGGGGIRIVIRSGC